MTINYQFVQLVEKMSNSDKDIRFMATNDMLTELNRDTFKLDEDSERKLVHGNKISNIFLMKLKFSNDEFFLNEVCGEADQSETSINEFS